MMAKARVRSTEFDSLLRSELEILIKQANLGYENTIIAQRYFLDSVAQADIAAELYYSRSTISSRLPGIITKMKNTARRLGYTP